MSSTASIPGWWIEFQKAIIGQMPRPGQHIGKAAAEWWTSHQEDLHRSLVETLFCGSDDVMTATINHRFSLQTMINRGRYDEVNSFIPEKFLVTDKASRVVKFGFKGPFDWQTAPQKVLDQLVQTSTQSAKIEDLLAFGAKYPHFQREHGVIALGSTADFSGQPYVAYLYGDLAKRGLQWRPLDEYGRGNYLALTIEEEYILT